MVALIDYLAGNLFGVEVAFDTLIGYSSTEAFLTSFRKRGVQSEGALSAVVAKRSFNISLKQIKLNFSRYQEGRSCDKSVKKTLNCIRSTESSVRKAIIPCTGKLHHNTL